MLGLTLVSSQMKNQLKFCKHVNKWREVGIEISHEEQMLLALVPGGQTMRSFIK